MAFVMDKSALSRQSTLTFPTSIGRIRVAATAEKLVEVKLGAPEMTGSHGSRDADLLCAQARDELLEYLAGRRRSFGVPFRLFGTSFQRSVWKAMTRIAFGTTITYGGLAERLGDPKAVRAVGVACGANPIPVIVPCHRIVAASGMGGFSGGLERKEWLLKMELTGRPPGELDAEGSCGDARSSSPSIEDIAGEQQSLF